MSWLVTGGAGYIGAHVVAVLRAAREHVVVLDDLSTGRPDRLPSDVPLVHSKLADTHAVRTALEEYQVEGVVHLAARKSVEESMRDPLGYHAANVGDLINLLAAVTSTATRLFLFSSSAAVYGNPAHVPVDEDAPTRPESPYGQTKLIGEWLVRDVARAYGLSWGALRYFNVVGAASAQLADTGEGNLVPLVLRAVKDGRRPRVFGLDYPTRDGSCIRDFIAVEDVARAHVLAARALRIGREVGVLNLGRGEGASVLEVLAQIGAASGRSVDYEAAERRAGDPAEVVANPQRAHRVLRWRAEHDLAGMIDSAWQAFKQQHGERRREGGQ